MVTTVITTLTMTSDESDESDDTQRHAYDWQRQYCNVTPFSERYKHNTNNKDD